MDLDLLSAAQPLCRGCLTPVPFGRAVWCSLRCQNFAKNHPHDFVRIFRWCKFCGVEIDHLSLKSKYCGQRCWARDRMQELPVSCCICRADLPDGQRSPYCSDRCYSIAYGTTRGEALPLAACALPECGATFQPFMAKQRCCSEKHGKLLYNRESRADGRQRNPEWDDKRRDRYHRRRAQMKATSTGEPVILAEIAERDRWMCHDCRKAIDPKLKWPDVMSASLDHLVPLSEGGAHDPANVRLAHARCNSARGNRGGGEQLLLIG